MAALRVPIQEAAITSLAEFLQGQFQDCVVQSHWPNPDKALWKETDPQKQKLITVLAAGETDEDIFTPEVLFPEEDPLPLGGNLFEYKWAVAALIQPWQIDVWTSMHPVRNDVVARLQTVLRQGVTTTLGHPSRDPFRQGLLYPLTGEWEGMCDVLVDSTDLYAGQNTGEREYRAMLKGDLQCVVVERAASAKLATFRFAERTRIAGQPPYSGNYDLVVTPDGKGGATWKKDVPP